MYSFHLKQLYNSKQLSISIRILFGKHLSINEVIFQTKKNLKLIFSNHKKLN